MRLIEANEGAELWSQDYDAEPASIFDVEEDIARKIAMALKLPPGPDPLVRSRDHFPGISLAQLDPRAVANAIDGRF